MNENGQLALLEFGIGVLLLVGMMQLLPNTHSPSTLEEKMRTCYDLLGVWSYSVGNIQEMVDLKGLQDRVSPDGSKGNYFCEGNRIKNGIMETLRIGIE